jgi:hypothetical protein
MTLPHGAMGQWGQKHLGLMFCNITLILTKMGGFAGLNFSN